MIQHQRGSSPAAYTTRRTWYSVVDHHLVFYVFSSRSGRVGLLHVQMWRLDIRSYACLYCESSVSTYKRDGNRYSHCGYDKLKVCRFLSLMPSPYSRVAQMLYDERRGEQSQSTTVFYDRLMYTTWHGGWLWSSSPGWLCGYRWRGAAHLWVLQCWK